jgi:signal transduction histidine kinase/ligand-binding sensor domain-containing protein
MKSFLALVAIGTLNLLLRPSPVLALDPSLDVSQYAHTAWTARDGFSLGNIYAIAQTPDGYLWLGSEFGLFRFDGVHAVPWHPPAGQQLPQKPYSLLLTRDGTLWIGTFAGLVSWNGGKLTRYPEVGEHFVTSLLEDREGTVWVGILGGSPDTLTGRLCAIRNGYAQCYGEDGAFGSFVWSLREDRSGALWAGAESGLWRWKPGPPKSYLMPGTRIDDMSTADDGRLLVGVRGTGLKQLTEDKLESYPIRDAINRNKLLPDRDVDPNKLLRDRDGGLWIGTHERGLIHIHNGRTDVFAKSDGLTGNITCSLFEDREGNIWVATTGGLERFRERAVTTISAEQGLSSDLTTSVLAATDGSIWVAAHDGLTEWKNGRTTIFRKANGLPDEAIQSLFQDDRGRIWVSTGHGLAYLKDGRFIAVNGVPSEEVYSITGDKADNLWLSGNRGLSHMRDGRLVKHFSWSALGRHEQAKVVLFDPKRGGVWLSFWRGGGVLYFKDGQVRASYTAADGLGKGPVAGLQLDRDGTVWAAIEEGGGLSRIKDGRIATLTTKNGLPCDTIHWSIRDDDGSVWLYTACGLVRVTRAELDAWITDPNRKVQFTVWDAADGVRLRAVSPAYYGPPVAKSTDGKLWFLMGEGVQVVDPHHLAFNKLPPPVHIEQIVADHKIYWQNSPGAGISNVRLPALTRDLWIDYSALSFVAPEKVHFKYKLEGQDRDWREVVNDREVQYSNLPPGSYRFRVIACNNSGVWNEAGDALDFSVAPAYYQTNWFRALCAVFLLVLLWAAYRLRVRQLRHEFALTLEARVGERTRIARDLHDTLLQSFHAVLLRLQTVSQLLRERPVEAQGQLDSTIEEVAEAITEGRDAVQGLRESTVQSNDLALAISTLGKELATDSNGDRPQFCVAVEGAARNLHPILRDEVYRIAAEALRNAFRHAHARTVEVEVRYDNEQFRLHVRDDGRGIDPAVLSSEGVERHFGLRGMRERAKLIGGKLVVWSKVDAGTEVELRISAGTAYTNARRASWLSRALAGKAKGDLGDNS